MRPVREYNLGLVLRQVRRSGPALAGDAGARDRAQQEHGVEPGRRADRRGAAARGPYEERPVGRPPAQSVELDPDGPYVLGLEINVDYLAVWATDLAGAVRHRSFVANDNRAASPSTVIAALARLAETALGAAVRRQPPPDARDRRVPGLVDPSGELAVAPNLGWVDVPVAACSSEALEDSALRLRVENEANLGAVAELVEGAGRGLQRLRLHSGEIGIGAGVVLRGELFRGASGFAGEFGHLTIDPYGPPCGCGGRGCLERLAGQDALLRLAGWDSRMRCEGTRPEWPGTMLADSARAGHARHARGAQPGRPHARDRDRLARRTCSTPRPCCWAATRAARGVAAGADRGRAGDARAGGAAHALPGAAGAPGRRGGGARSGGAEPAGGARGGGLAPGERRVSVRLAEYRHGIRAGLGFGAAAGVVGLSFGVVAQPVMGSVAPIVMSVFVFCRVGAVRCDRRCYAAGGTRSPRSRPARC